MNDGCTILVPRPMPGLLSLVVPVYNEEEVLPLLLGRLQALMESVACPCELILVNDGSRDRSIHVLKEAAERDLRIRVIALARNFGHQIAATAGLDAARGDAVVLMDADLQDPPELVLDMLEKYCAGYDVVYAQRVRRIGETPFKKVTAWLFYRFMRTAISKDLPVDTGDFRLMSRRCLDTLNRMRETHRFLRGMVVWVGFSQTAVQFVRPQRAAGQTKYPLHKMLRFAWTAASSFSAVPLRLSLWLGAALFSVGLLYSVYGLWGLFTGRDLVRGWLSLVILNCLSAGSILLCMGVLGEYIAKIFEEIKDRPLYVVAEEFGHSSDDRVLRASSSHRDQPVRM